MIAKKRSSSLRRKLVASMALLMLATLSASTYLGLQELNDLKDSYLAQRRTAGEQAISAQGQILTRSFASSAALPLAGSDFTYLHDFAESLVAENKRVLWVLVSDSASGKIAARSSSAPSELGTRGDPLGPLLAKTGGPAVVSERDAQDPTHVLFGAKVYLQDRLLGEVRLALSSADLEDELRAAIADAREEARAAVQKMVLVAVLIVLLAVVAGGYQAGRITRPLNQLAGQAQRIAAGDFDHPLDVGRDDEIGDLGRTFTSMAYSLRDLLAERTHKASLDKELEVARTIQASMSPSDGFVLMGSCAIAGTCRMAEVCGGDWWCYKALKDGRMLLLVGDVTGHGIPAAMVAAAARGALESATSGERCDISPNSLLDAMDDAVGAVAGGNLNMTCFVSILDPVRKIVDYASAGHPFPYCYEVDGKGRIGAVSPLVAVGPPLGDGYTRNEKACGSRPLSPGQLFVFTTDGLTDRKKSGSERFGDRRLRASVKGFEVGTNGMGVMLLRDRILQEVDRFAEAEPPDDDATLVLAQFVPIQLQG